MDRTDADFLGGEQPVRPIWFWAPLQAAPVWRSALRNRMKGKAPGKSGSRAGTQRQTNRQGR